MPAMRLPSPRIGPACALVLLPLALLGCAAAKPDNLVSAVLRQECSALNLDRGLPYCRAVPGPPEPPPFCTRSRGSVDCWRQPPVASPPYRGLADTPGMPPPERQARPWPRLMEDAAPVMPPAAMVVLPVPVAEAPPMPAAALALAPVESPAPAPPARVRPRPAEAVTSACTMPPPATPAGGAAPNAPAAVVAPAPAPQPAAVPNAPPPVVAPPPVARPAAVPPANAQPVPVSAPNAQPAPPPAPAPRPAP